MSTHEEKRQKKLKKRAEWQARVEASKKPGNKKDFGKGLLYLIGTMVVAASAFIFSRMN